MPGYQSPYLNQGASYIQQGAQYAVPSLESLNTASARLRSRMEGVRRGNQQALQDQYGSNVNSGQYGAAIQKNFQDANNATATGVADLEDKYNQSKQQGAQILGTLGQNFGNLGTADINAQHFGSQDTNEATKNTNDFTIGTVANTNNATKNANDLTIGQGANANNATKNANDLTIGQGANTNDATKNAYDYTIGNNANANNANQIANNYKIGTSDNLTKLIQTMGQVGNTVGGTDAYGNAFNSNFQNILKAAFENTPGAGAYTPPAGAPGGTPPAGGPGGGGTSGSYRFSTGTGGNAVWAPGQVVNLPGGGSIAADGTVLNSQGKPYNPPLHVWELPGSTQV